jgi:hypothetical protein
MIDPTALRQAHDRLRSARDGGDPERIADALVERAAVARAARDEADIGSRVRDEWDKLCREDLQAAETIRSLRAPTTVRPFTTTTP